jgi:hypothetical protein
MSLATSAFRRLGAVLTLAAAVAAVTVPVALANHQDVGVTTALEEIRGTAGAPDAVDRYLRAHLQPTGNDGIRLITDTLGGNGDGVSLITDTLGGNGGAASPATEPTSSSGWPGAGIAATACGMVVVLLAGSLLALRRHRSITA